MRKKATVASSFWWYLLCVIFSVLTLMHVWHPWGGKKRSLLKIILFALGTLIFTFAATLPPKGLLFANRCAHTCLLKTCPQRSQTKYIRSSAQPQSWKASVAIHDYQRHHTYLILTVLFCHNVLYFPLLRNHFFISPTHVLVHFLFRLDRIPPEPVAMLWLLSGDLLIGGLGGCCKINVSAEMNTPQV